MSNSAFTQPTDPELTAIAGLTSAANKLPYYTGSGTAALADFTSFGRSIVDDADASAVRTTLGLVIGTNVQAQDAELSALAGLTSAADKLPYFTGAGTAGLADFTSTARTLLDDSSTSAMRTTLGVAIGTNVQAYNANLTTFAGIAPSANVQTLLGAADYAAFKTSLSLNSVENTALSTWAGTSNLTTLGTITTGTWTGTTIAVANGGTGQTSYTDGQLLIGNTTGNTLTKATLTGTSNQVIVTNGNGSITLSTPQSIDTAASVTFDNLSLTHSSSGSAFVGLTLTNSGAAANSDIVLSFRPGNLSTARAQVRGMAPGGSDAELALFTSNNNASPTEKVRINDIGNVGIGVTAPTNLLSLGGNSARIFWMERHTTANTAGNSLTVQSGGATSAATDKSAGDLILGAGLSTGTGASKVRIQTNTTALSTGTSDNTATDRIIATSPKSVTNNTATTLFSLTNANSSATVSGVVAGVIRYCVEVYDGTDTQVEEGIVSYHVTNKAGTIANNTVVKSANQQAATAGTLTVTFTITAANPALVQVNANSSLTPSTGYPRITSVLENLSNQAVTVS